MVVCVFGASGAEIDKEHGNANIIMGRVLKALSAEVEYGIVALAGALDILKQNHFHNLYPPMISS